MVGLIVVGGAAACIAIAIALLNPAPRGRIPDASAPMATVAAIYMEAAAQQDCGLTRALTTSNTSAWCDAPRLISYTLSGRTGDDGECMTYVITITASGDGSMKAGTQPWSLCFRQTAAGWRLWDQGQG
ncbi:hypothetical protein E6C70_06675 [Glaciibacter flavus]|uniref:Uncharacterized protein n=1 Tax=Orlajensenia flava TaxID=2565934 RepID=A0A4S4FZB0_9MICO|nr:hypothetical protein [Glaciibacter flavus]THG35711.1 hypothetical protein E6C70_06675 [Glaciibacter flavus]